PLLEDEQAWLPVRYRNCRVTGGRLSAGFLHDERPWRYWTAAPVSRGLGSQCVIRRIGSVLPAPDRYLSGRRVPDVLRVRVSGRTALARLRIEPPGRDRRPRWRGDRPPRRAGSAPLPAWRPPARVPTRPRRCAPARGPPRARLRGHRGPRG